MSCAGSGREFGAWALDSMRLHERWLPRVNVLEDAALAGNDHES